MDVGTPVWGRLCGGLPGPGLLWGCPHHSPPRSVCAGGSWRCAEAPCPVAARCPGGLVHAPGSCLRRCDSAEPNGTCAGIADGCVCPPGTVFLVCDPLLGGSPGGPGSQGTWGSGGLGVQGTRSSKGVGGGTLASGTGGPSPSAGACLEPPMPQGPGSPRSPQPRLTGGVSHRQDGRCVSPDECPCHHGGRLYRPNDTIVHDCNTW